MNAIAKKMVEFKKLDYYAKKRCVTKLLSMLKDEAPVFEKIFRSVSNLEYVPEYMFESVYQDILNFSSQLKNEQMHDMIQKMREKQKHFRDEQNENQSNDQKDADRIINLLYV